MLAIKRTLVVLIVNGSWKHYKYLTMVFLLFTEQCKAMGPLIDAELEKIDRYVLSYVCMYGIENNKKKIDWTLSVASISTN